MSRSHRRGVTFKGARHRASQPGRHLMRSLLQTPASLYRCDTNISIFFVIYFFFFFVVSVKVCETSNNCLKLSLNSINYQEKNEDGNNQDHLTSITGRRLHAAKCYSIQSIWHYSYIMVNEFEINKTIPVEAYGKRYYDCIPAHGHLYDLTIDV